MIIAQLSDPHITADGDGSEASGPAALLARAAAHLMQLPARPDVVLVTGDCVNNGLPAEYDRFQAILSSLPFPIYVVPGNHDDRSQLLERFGAQGQQALDGFVQYVVDDRPLRLIALDTQLPNSGAGLLCERRLEWLVQRLREAPDRPTLLFMHHPPIRTGLAVPDSIGLEGAEALAALLADFPQVERIVAGHLHMALTRRFAGTTVMTCPAIAESLLPDITQPQRLIVQKEPPACLIHVWQEGVGLASYTSIIGAYGQPIELHDGTQWR